MVTTSNLTFKRLGSMALTFLMVFTFAVATAAPVHAEVNIVSNIVASPDPFNPYEGAAKISFDLAQDAYISMYIRENGSNIRTIIENARANAGNDYLMWDGRNDDGVLVHDGTYQIIVEADNYYRDSGLVEVTYNTATPVNITDLSASRTTFDPYDQTTTINFTTDAESTLTTLTVYRGSDFIDQLIPSSEQNNSLSAGHHSRVWDGRDQFGSIVGEGTYTVTLSVRNNYGFDSEYVYVAVDYVNSNNDEKPEITNVDVDPYRFDPDDTESELEFYLNTCADVTVTVMDDDDDEVVELEDDELCQGWHRYDWDGDDDDNDQVNDGIYYFRVFAENNGGEDAVHANVRVDDGYNNDDDDREPIITRVDVDPDRFDPYDEDAELTFRLNTCADVTIEVRDEDNDVVRELLDDKRLCSGDHDYDWDGEDDGDDRVRQDQYEFYIRAENSEGRDVARADVEVDYNGHSFDDEDQCAGYNDVDENDPYCDAIEYVSTRGVFDGYPDGNFRPYQAINRAEATKVILVGFDYPLYSPDGTNVGFWDVAPEAWYIIFLRTGVNLNIIQGYPDGSFQPARTVNRVELAKIFFESAQVSMPHCSFAPYVDTPIQADTAWYMDYVCYAKTYDIIDPDYNNRFNPAKPMTRGDVALLFYNFANRGTGTVSSSSSSSTGDPEIRNLQLSDYTVDPGENIRIEYYLEASADVVIEIVDEDDDVVRTLVDDRWRAEGSHSVSWDGEDDDGDELDDGEYTVRVEADNSDGFDRDELSFEVDDDSSSSSIRISNLEVDEDRFDPDREDLRISFRINQDADVTIKVYDDDNDRVAIIWNERSRDDGTYTIVWNGTDDDGDTLRDGDYTIKVIAVDENDEDEEDRDEVDFEIDS